MTESAAQIAVILVNWNGRNLLPACLQSIFRQTWMPTEVVVVDNGSTDGSIEYLEQAWSGQLRLVRHAQNLGFTAGVNAGIRATSAEWIALLNTDAVADPGWLKALMAEVSLRPDMGMFACKIFLASEDGRIDKAGHLLYGDGLNGGRGYGQRDCGQFDHPEEVLFPDGCAALYRRRIFEEVGLFDEQFFAYGDDAELGLRARLFGWKCLYVPTAVVHHLHSAGLGATSSRKAMLVERNRIWLACKLFPWWLLLLNPWFSLWRYSWHAWSIILGQGSAGTLVRERSPAALLRALAEAHISAWRGMPEIRRKHKEIFQRIGSKMNCRDWLQLMIRYRISAKELALCNR